MNARQDPLFDVNQQVKAIDVCDEASNLRTQDKSLVFVTDPLALDDVDPPCPCREGVRHDRFSQHQRGDAIGVRSMSSSGEET